MFKCLICASLCARHFTYVSLLDLYIPPPVFLRYIFHSPVYGGGGRSTEKSSKLPSITPLVNDRGTDGLEDGPTTRGRAGPEATAALPIPAALLPAAAHEGHPGALQTCCQAEFPSSFG